MIHGAKTKQRYATGAAPAPMGSGPGVGWGMIAQAVPDALTAGSQLYGGYWSKSGRGAEAAGKAQLAQAHANQTMAQAALITAQSNASQAASSIGMNTLLLAGGGLLIATFVLLRRKK